MKVVTVVGTRPQFIKASPLSRALRKTHHELLVYTGQHYDPNMSDVFFEELRMPAPAYRLEIGGGSHGAQTGKMLEAIESVLLEETPDLVLVYGDTNSTLAGALAAAKLNFPVAHVEAGLRSFDRRMPEEVNRVAADHVSDLLFAPTRTAAGNLRKEGLPESRIHQVGDVMYDAAIFFGRMAEEKSKIIQDLDLRPGHYVLATVHRAENTDDPVRLEAILDGLNAVSAEIPVVLPLHPRTRNAIRSKGIAADRYQQVRLLEPLGYLDMALLEKNARLIATDSGGVQKEAFFHGVPCVTLRESTEWVELVELGWNRLVSPDCAGEVTSSVFAALERMPEPVESPYGDGRSSQRIAEILRARCG